MKVKDVAKLDKVGIAIDDVHYKYDKSSNFGIQPEVLAFTVKGTVSSEFDGEDFVDTLLLVFKAKQSDSQSVQDLLELLRTTLELTKQ